MRWHEPSWSCGRGHTAAVLEITESASGPRLCQCSPVTASSRGGQPAAPIVAHRSLPGEAYLVTGARDPDTLASELKYGLRRTARRAGAFLLQQAARIALGRMVPDPLTGMFACIRSELLDLRRGGSHCPDRLCYEGGAGSAGDDPVRQGRPCDGSFPESPRGGVEAVAPRVRAERTLRQLVGVLSARRSANPLRSPKAGKTRTMTLLRGSTHTNLRTVRRGHRKCNNCVIVAPMLIAIMPLL